MADKEVLINSKRMMYGTGVKGARETSTKSTTTFDGVITQGTKNTPHTVEVSKMSYEGEVSYTELYETIENMLDIPQMVTVREVKRPYNEDPFVLVRNYYECLVTDDSYEIKAEDATVENLKFRASRMEWYTEEFTE